MTVEEIIQAADDVMNVAVGGSEVADLYALARILNDLERSGSKPLLTIFPTDLYIGLFDDGDFEENLQKFAEIQNKHTRMIFEEYATWKVLQENAKKVKK